jgi:RNA polymerase sigma-70 factor, ECF subfamily
VHNEEDLIKRAKKFEHGALTEIYDMYNEAIYRYAYRLTGNQMQAEDCVSETFNRFLNALKKGRGPTQNIRAYLYRIAHNWITDQFRKKTPIPLLLDNEIIPSKQKDPETQVLENLSIDLIRNSLRNLTPNQRQVFVLKYLEGWNNKEISSLINKPVSAVKSLQHRALNAIRKQINRNTQENQ